MKLPIYPVVLVIVKELVKLGTLLMPTAALLTLYIIVSVKPY